MRVVALALTAATVLASVGSAHAQQAWPDRPIRMIVTSAAGGGIDLMARILSDGLSRQLPKPVVVENNGGAGGLIATRLVAKAAPDGYTFLFQGPAYADLPFVYKDPGFDVHKDFAPVSLVAQFPLVIVARPSLGVKTLSAFIALAKKSPGKYSYGSSGVGGASNIAFEALDSQAGIKLLHVPFRGSGQSSAAVMSGQVDVTIDGLAPQLGNIKSGRVIPLAITTRERAPQLPQIPTVTETVPGFEYPMWVAVFAPSGTPKAVIAKMASAIKGAVNDPATKKRFEELMVTPVGSTPSQLQEFVNSQLAFHKKVIEKAHIKIGGH